RATSPTRPTSTGPSPRRSNGSAASTSSFNGGTFLCCQRAIAQMLKQPSRGVIVNVASNFAFVAEPTASVYCASKGVVVSLTKGLALEVGGEGIRVNALCPGATATAINREYRRRPEIIESWARKTPLQQVGRDESLGLPDAIARSA